MVHPGPLRAPWRGQRAGDSIGARSGRATRGHHRDRYPRGVGAGFLGGFAGVLRARAGTHPLGLVQPSGGGGGDPVYGWSGRGGRPRRGEPDGGARPRAGGGEPARAAARRGAGLRTRPPYSPALRLRRGRLPSRRVPGGDRPRGRVRSRTGGGAFARPCRGGVHRFESGRGGAAFLGALGGARHRVLRRGAPGKGGGLVLVLPVCRVGHRRRLRVRARGGLRFRLGSAHPPR